ncbi:MAG: hypothetical protein EBX40_03950, partial [Gammaproteobacteria bacterium]|nr:hypothetical protein [Gammaproteobacteria bacterium]
MSSTPKEIKNGFELAEAISRVEYNNAMAILPGLIETESNKVQTVLELNAVIRALYACKAESLIQNFVVNRVVRAGFNFDLVVKHGFEAGSVRGDLFSYYAQDLIAALLVDQRIVDTIRGGRQLGKLVGACQYFGSSTGYRYFNEGGRIVWGLSSILSRMDQLDNQGIIELMDSLGPLGALTSAFITSEAVVSRVKDGTHLAHLIRVLLSDKSPIRWKTEVAFQSDPATRWQVINFVGVVVHEIRDFRGFSDLIKALKEHHLFAELLEKKPEFFEKIEAMDELAAVMRAVADRDDIFSRCVRKIGTADRLAQVIHCLSAEEALIEKIIDTSGVISSESELAAAIRGLGGIDDLIPKVLAPLQGNDFLVTQWIGTRDPLFRKLLWMVRDGYWLADAISALNNKEALIEELMEANRITSKIGDWRQLASVIRALGNRWGLIEKLIDNHGVRLVQSTNALLAIIPALDSRDDLLLRLARNKVISHHNPAAMFGYIAYALRHCNKEALISELMSPSLINRMIWDSFNLREVLSALGSREDLISRLMASDGVMHHIRGTADLRVVISRLGSDDSKLQVKKICFRHRIEVLFEREIRAAGDTELGLVLSDLRHRYRSASDSVDLSPFIYQLERVLSHPKSFFSRRSADAWTGEFCRSQED